MPEELAKLDPQLIEQVCNDIVETGKTSWDDIAGAWALLLSSDCCQLSGAATCMVAYRQSSGKHGQAGLPARCTQQDWCKHARPSLRVTLWDSL